MSVQDVPGETERDDDARPGTPVPGRARSALLDVRDALLDARDALLDARDAALGAPRRAGAALLGRARGSVPSAGHAARTMRRAALLGLAAATVLGVLVLIQGTGERSGAGPKAGAPQTGEQQQAPVAPAGEPVADGEAGFVRRDTWSLLLPAGWTEAEPIAEETFRAQTEGAEAILWVERDPGLSLQRFVERSLDSLRELDPEARVSHTAHGPTAESRVVQLRAAVPGPDGAGAPYVVTLRAGGPFRYYLATAVDSDASAAARDGAARIHGSFTPEAG